MSDTSIDLATFCARKPYIYSRTYLLAPLHFGEYTIATNGHIAVRVPRAAGASDTESAPVETIFGLFKQHCLEDLGELPLFTPPTGECACDWCGGDGYEDNFDTTFANPCEACNGTGQMPLLNKSSVELGGAVLGAQYFEMIRALPFAKLSYASLPTSMDRPISFVFDGGIGMLAAMRRPQETHFSLIRPGGLA
ncbi:hypothetical protein JP74_09075 [Devosia sp. 17-2-E-8]|nr:hypothetical protein JP74_09075 [Devosia sp. 17-2-E-8]